MTAATASPGYDTDDWGYPIQTRTGIRCGECEGRHQNVPAVRACHETAENHRRQHAEEIRTEDAWLRAAEAGSPSTWRDEELERMAGASGLPVPPGFC